MTTLADTERKLIPKVKAPPEWGIEPVPPSHRVLGLLDYAVLWGDLGIGLLVMLTGTFLVPGLGLGDALWAILIGSIVGSLMLAVIGAIGSDTAVPTMVLLRPVLGLRGSYLPTALNVLQLIGWTIFEFIVMGVAANAISQAVFGVSNYAVWTAIFALVVILMGVGGPVGVVRQWLSKFAVWLTLGAALWLTFHLLTTYDIAALLNKPGDGTLGLAIAIDLVIAMPISWLPLVADYNRFARRTEPAFWGTFLSYVITNAWYFALGAMVLLGAGVQQTPIEFATAIALIAGWFALLILLADETNNAWADLYSSAVSVQNVFPRIKQRWLVVGLGVVSYLVAVLLDITQYENFLFIIGSFFVPLFGILAADYFVLRRRRYQTEELYRTHGAYWYQGGVNLWGILAWLVGVAVYHITNPSTLGTLFSAWPQMVPSSLANLGGSLPSFIMAFVVYVVLGALALKGSQQPQTREETRA